VDSRTETQAVSSPTPPDAKFQSRASSGSGNVRQFSDVQQESVCEELGRSLWFGQHDSSSRAATTKS
jgi:hypothetical protein